MISNTIERLTYLCNTIPPLLSAIPEAEFSLKSAPDKWSNKQIIGHLIDSAANNHQRFVRSQFENIPFIIYDQDKWNEAGRYQDMSGAHVIQFWQAFNLHLLELIKRIPEKKLDAKCQTNEAQPVTLAWLIEDYVKHMEHHLRQVLAHY